MQQVHEALKRLKKDERPLTVLEKLSGLPRETIRDLRNGITDNPRLTTCEGLLKLYPPEAA